MLPVVARFCLSIILLCGVYFAHAAQERYDYDGLGRLIRVIDEQGRVTEYVYDAAGNILQVIAGAAAQTPTITTISPNTLRRGETRAFQITGTGLTGANLSVADPGLDITNLRVSATQVLFNLTATTSAVFGSQVLTLSNAAGSTTTTIAVNPLQPKVGMTPLPIAVPPTGAARSFFVSLSSPDNIAHVINLASANPAIATVAPASVTLAAGQTEAVVSIAGQTAGTTAINLTSATLPGTSVPVFVTSEFTGITTSFAQPVGVTLESAPGSISTSIGPIVSPHVGVVVGAHIAAVTPSVLVIGTGPTRLVISGAGLQGVTGVSIQPADGLTLGAVSVAPDGLSVTAPVSVAADAPRTVRKVVLAGAQQPYLPSRPNANQLLIAVPAPELSSIDPLVIATGTTSATLTVRGRNLQNAQAVNITPSNGISVGAPPVVNADGTVLTTGISVPLITPVGERIVSVITPSGTSSSVPSPANTLHVVSEIQSTVTPVIAPLVGVVLGDVAPPTTSLNAYSNLVGVTFGPTVRARTPGAGIIGETVQLTFSGSELQSVSAVELIPGTGVTVSSPGVSADGKSVTVGLTIAADAPQTLRALRVRAGTLQVPFSDPASAQFRVTAPLPVIQSVTPIVYVIGAAPVTATVRGINLQNAQLMRADPDDGISIAAPVVNAAGTELIAAISVAASAVTGSRVLVVASSAGESALTASPANTIQLVTTTAGNVSPVVAPNVGVILESTTTPSALVGPIVAPALGVVLEDPNPPPNVQEIARAMLVGVAIGPYATDVQATPLAPNTSGTLTIFGNALNDVTNLSVVPSSNVTLGALQVAPDGSQASATITVQSAAVPGVRRVQVTRGADKVPFIPTGSDTFTIGVGTPNIDSITPILGSRGQTVAMIIRGQNFQHLTAVTAAPATGLSIDSAPVVNATGTEITLRIGIAADAPLGGRVIRVYTAGGATTADAVPANTFTVQP